MPTPNPDRNMFAIRAFFKEYLDLRRDKEHEADTVDSIRKGIEFRGTNLWVLIFAIFIASLGLTVNSTAVIIGAMLISPLMGPIMGIGLGVGINDIELMKRSAKSYLITTLFSVVTATLFFLVFPVTGNQSELLARTSPTIYDVFIALMGGLAGIVATTSKNKGNVLPGVAIATALMPPLCTAGFGLATGNLVYFLGAFYLYFINSVFICAATLICIRLMGFRKKQQVDSEREKQVRKYILALVVITMIPAIYLTVGILRDTYFDSAANKFIREQLSFDNAQVVDKRITRKGKDSEIRVVMVGQEVPDSTIAVARSRMAEYSLENVRLVILQGVSGNTGTDLDITALRSKVLEDFYQNGEERLRQQTLQIDSLERKLGQFKAYGELGKSIIPELKVLYPTVRTFSIAEAIEYNVDSLRTDTIPTAIVSTSKRMDAATLEKLTEWLQARIGNEELKVMVK
ncbi:MAG: TIGR00341 family protein [Bacteroidaceae bacterium]|nr:TIGR00341 family protein [Bacteroidaceae bacterium]